MFLCGMFLLAHSAETSSVIATQCISPFGKFNVHKVFDFNYKTLIIIVNPHTNRPFSHAKEPSISIQHP